METLNTQIAHMRNVLILTDGDGVILHGMGSQHLQKGFEHTASVAGASWREDHRGTHAIATVLIEQAAMTVHGAEHFMAQHLEMQRHSGNISAVARDLGISRNTWYRMLKTMGMH